MKSLEQQYRNLARKEPDSKTAQDYLWVAQRCKELTEKNKRLSGLLVESSALPMKGDLGDLASLEKLPDAWDGNCPPQVEFIRRVARSASSPRANWVLIQAAEDVLWLMARNRTLREVMDRYCRSKEDRTERNEWVAAYRSEVEQQAECYCVFVAELPSICEFCQPYCNEQRSSLGEDDRSVVPHDSRKAS